jgi:hypothetical protein
LSVKIWLVKDVIGLSVTAIAEGPGNRYVLDVPDSQQLLRLHRAKLDMKLARQYF